MKKSFIGYALTLVMAFGIASCGKSGGGGGGGITSTSLITSGLPQSSTDVVNSFNSWYASTQEGSGGLSNTTPPYNGGNGRYELTRTAGTSSSGGGNCEQKPIKVFGVTVGYYSVCSNSVSSNTTGGTGVTSEVLIVANQAKSANATLASIANSGPGTLVDAQFYNNAFNLAFRRADNSVVVYVIDTRYHSAFQPMQVIETSSGSTTTLTNITKKASY